MPQPHLRAADTDRAAVADVLGRHMSAGRLTLDEFDERLTRAYAAKTFGELDELTADLPALSPDRATTPERPQAPQPWPRPTPVPMTGCGAGPWQRGSWGHGVPGHTSPGHGATSHLSRRDGQDDGEDLRSAWRGWLATALIVLTVWAATSVAAWEFLYFWPVWVFGPWGAVLLARTLTARRGDDSQQRRLES